MIDVFIVIGSWEAGENGHVTAILYSVVKQKSHLHKNLSKQDKQNQKLQKYSFKAKVLKAARKKYSSFYHVDTFWDTY